MLHTRLLAYIARATTIENTGMQHIVSCNKGCNKLKHCQYRTVARQHRC
uniref:Uncharacterized protein n=1 Tax=Arundo donax TaxID=35708 RepID=A0A0A9G319_ARUDO